MRAPATPILLPFNTLSFLPRSIPSTIEQVDDKGSEPESRRDRQAPMADAAKRAAAGRFEAMRTFATVGTVGLSFVIALVIGTALGLWLDRLTGWSPVFFFVFFLCGLAAGVLNVYRTISRFSK